MGASEDEGEDFDQTMTVTICLDDDDGFKGETLNGISFFDIIEQPSTSNYLLEVRPEIRIGQLPNPILRVLQLRLNSPAVGTMRNWEYISMLLGMTLDEITLIRNNPNPMEQVLNSLSEVSLNTLLTSIADCRRLDILISLRPHLRNIEANLNKMSQPSTSSNNNSFIQALPGPSKRPIANKLPSRFILVTHHEPPRPRNNANQSQQYHLNTIDSAIGLSSQENIEQPVDSPNKQFKRLLANFKTWGKTADMPVLDIDKCIDESNTIASLQLHFQEATHIVLVASRAYSEEVCSSKMTTDSRIEIKRQLHELMQMEYVNKSMRNERFRVIVMGAQDKAFLPIGWPNSTIIYTFPDNHADIVKRLFANT